MSEASQEGFSLTKAFKKINHVRHIMMDVAMFSMAIGAVVATGGAIGLFDPVSIFLHMHIPSIADISAIGDFVRVAFENAANGHWLTASAALDPHSLHAGHAAVTAASEPVLSESARALMGITP